MEEGDAHVLSEVEVSGNIILVVLFRARIVLMVEEKKREEKKTKQQKMAVSASGREKKKKRNHIRWMIKSDCLPACLSTCLIAPIFGLAWSGLASSVQQQRQRQQRGWLYLG